MSALSDALETSLLNHLLRATAYTPLGTLHVGLFLTDPGESGVTGEVSGGSYARVAVTNNATNFGLATSAGKTNATDIVFPEASAAWGTPKFWAVYDSAVGVTDVMLIHGPLLSPRYIAIGDTPKIAAGAMNVSFSSSTGIGLTDYAKTKLLDLVFGAYAFTTPATVYAAVGLGVVSAGFTEWTDSGYTRQAVTFGAPSGGVASNSGVITMNTAVVSSVGPLTQFQLLDSATVGNALLSGALSSARTIPVGDSCKFAIGSISVTLQ